jgi:pimeloyl-ACP methyl ester carboxylesterase
MSNRTFFPDPTEPFDAGTPSRPSRRALLAGGVLAVSLPIRAETPASGLPDDVEHKWIRADGVDVFYREAGPADAPVLLLLHGFANSSFYFRHLMPKLADRFRMIAPDLPSFGFTEIPAERNYLYDFASLARTMTAFVDALNLKRYIMYVFDYGAPVGWELALNYPDRVGGIVSQNGNAYVEGLGEKAWAPLRDYWANPSPEKREPIRARMSLEGVKAAYFQGVPDPRVIEPESYTLDAAIPNCKST